jgi:ABC-type multidrug transport system fused ATPase/permease subunit
VKRFKLSPEGRFLGVFPKADRLLAVLWWIFIGLRGVLPAIFAVAMGSLVGAAEQHHSLIAPLGLIGFVFVGMNALAPVHGTVGSLLGAKAGAWLHDRLMGSAIAPDGLAHLERPDLADDLTRAREFDQGIVAPPLEAALPYIANGFTDIVAAVAQAILVMTYHWWAGLALALAWGSTHVLLKESAMWQIFEADDVVNQRRHVEYAYRMTVDAPAAKEVRLFGLSGWAVERFTRLRRRAADILFEESRLRQRPLRWSLGLILAANALVFGSLARAAVHHAIGLPALVKFAQASIGVALLAFGEFDWWFRGSARPIPVVLDLAERMRASGSVRSGSRAADRMPAHEIVFDNVSFTYPTPGMKVLEGFDLTIPAGASLAIVGPNGAGKTTIAKLLCHLYDPTDGAVRIDGVDLREFDRDSWRSRVAAVFQDYVRFELPLRDNVAPNGASDDVVIEALRRAGASDLAPIDTILSRAYDGGTDLSGGQWQRVALARALCAVGLGAGVVVLDEPTAQLDVRGEAEIFDRILDATRGRTTILISHRFSTVRHADLICVLDHGRVVELGSHDDLMAAGGRYKAMFELQASRFYEETDEHPALA